MIGLATPTRRAGAAGLVSLAALIVGSGCGGHRASGSLPPAGGARASHAVYRWLVLTRGAPPSIAQENSRAGTRAWRLPGPAGEVGGVARGSVEGYVAEQAVGPGQIERVYVNAPGARSVTIAIYRMGWYRGDGGRLVLQSRRLRARRQPPCTHRAATGLTECRWTPTLSFPIPAALPSGVYVVKLTSSSGGERDCLFVDEGSAARRAPLLVQISTASYEAYNAWGGDSLYPGRTRRVGVTGTNQGVEVSYDRPYDSDTGAGEFFARDVAAVRFLERYGYPVAYSTNESIDRDPAQLLHRRALVDIGHSEYWSQRAEHAFAHARDRGTSLLFLSSDTLAWRVRFAPATGASSEARAPDHRMVGYKEHVARDPVRSPASGPFPDLGARMTGSAYNGCITPRLHVPGPPTYRYYAWTPAAHLKPSWLFAGSAITRSTRIPGIVGYELDQRTSRGPAGVRLVGSGSAPCMAALGVTGHLAETTMYTAPSGALVFATGTLGWELALSPDPNASPDAPRAPDRRVVRMTRNLLAHVLRKKGRAGV